MIQSKNPATEEVLKSFKEVSEKELEKKLSLAKKAFESWKRTSFKERATLMHKLGEYLNNHAEEFSKLQMLEMGKTMKSGPFGIKKCGLLCDYYADNAEIILKNEKLDTGKKEQYVEFDPLGIVLAIMPWNFPFWQVYRFAVPALMAGNVGLLKHASNVPQCAEAIEESFRACGFPEGVFQNLFLSSSRVADLIRDNRISAVTLTGSEKAGSEVASVAGAEIKKVVLELGGSDPFIVFADADIDEAAKIAVTARLQGNVGQSCISAKRFIVEESIKDIFIKNVVKELSKLSIGDPSDSKIDIGPLATEQILLDVEKQVEKSVSLGAKIVYKGVQKNKKGYFYSPVVMTNVKKGMPVYDEEVFGPVMPIISFKNEKEAIQIANDTRYGLGASIFTSDMKKAKRIIPQIEAGNVCVNDMVKSDPRAPFGGIKKSGYGRELGTYGIKEFVNIKNVYFG
ncbi:MAG: Aldehyde Dehydrogenase [Parcubacteria group bacterium GW2011_GWC1_35_8]|uniref:Succinate-semialdehyde dehydrogenase n=3 Tax=Candidatus Nomuraibacteriota TaxID=1752729 RepID=A0A1F6YWF5_9BACT|nr:MAG: Aldehyde Dehydrogenase [Parcubacteria group bacterium GW2011_GWC1_35_8]KKP89577.1 MAG: Aldehyde Dehydrogenase [Candidatus Nomurabacteria bacterium GW2011_GWC2_35_8]OGJ04757.1 MAG: succinate-semialdehyde dehydrogenase [Candidatus Nomurabacteria bacterium RIFOXYA2_FULL_35_9]OGJ06591.1 MAG: succinate-semialdehyde dehydrogenase [Candidatus Nomurabacteria bacterium RIFOXYA1_FULL_35_17]OGJ10741.1 MAG: succinate-semialdehyde dehydrogenase [Candidatus Nomurabacteria bacterium RIFOXYC2_FULL_36_1